MSSTALPSTALDYDAFLQAHLYGQPPQSARCYEQAMETLWIKRAGSSNAAWRYHLLGIVARGLRVPVLTPVPNPGGQAAIAIEVARLRDLAARGLRVPEVLAACDDGFLMRHLGAPGEDTPSLGNEMEQAATRGSAAVLALWKQGLQSITKVHKAGTCLSQAFARNLVRCPDGVIGYVDFEDDPAAALPLPLCHARDALCFAHSTAWILHAAAALPTARAQWQAWAQTLSPDAQQTLSDSVARMAWAARLPDNQKLGRDAQRIRMAWELLRP
ncbi:MAG: hypothetical protein LBV14_12290 [Acidovorax sp.]|nr:hypothetical protein [Acidovorax sp.]